MVPYKKKWIYKGLSGDDLRKVLPILTRRERELKVPAIAFDLFLSGAHEKNEEYLRTSTDFSTNLAIEHRMATALEWLAGELYENGAYAYEAGDGLVGFETILRLANFPLETRIGTITFATKTPFLWNPSGQAFNNRERIGNWVMGKTGITSISRLGSLKHNLNGGNTKIRDCEVSLGDPSWWLEVTRRMIVGKSYYPIRHLDVEEEIIEDPITGQKQLKMVKMKRPRPTKAERFNTDIFLHGECWRFSQIFSMMVRKPTIPVWMDNDEKGDHIYTLCDGWFWDCTGCYLLEDLEDQGWKLATIVNDPGVPDKCNLYRFTHIHDELEEEKD